MTKYYKPDLDVLRFCVSLFVFLIVQCVSAQTKTSWRKQLFDFNWKFCPGDSAVAAGINFNDNSWRKLDLPHDWSIEGGVDPDNPSKGSGGYFSGGNGWYRKTFGVPANWKDKVVSIYFEGVYMNAEVFINCSNGIIPQGCI